MNYKISTIASIVKGRYIGEADSAAENVATDTRTLAPNSIFFALRAKTDGHIYVQKALNSGAKAVVVDERAYAVYRNEWEQIQNARFVIVDDVYRALGALARFHRLQFRIPVVNVTGSAGKTTTKECLRQIFSLRYNTKTNVGNFNNHIGLPLSLLSLNSSDEAAVFEIGASAPREIAHLASLAMPEAGIITCIQPAHLQGFGSLEAIYQTKLELAEHLSRSSKPICVMGDDAVLVTMARAICPRVTTFGFGAANDFRLSHVIQRENCIEFVINGKYHFSLNGFGTFNAMNALGAISAASHFGFDLKEIAHQWRELPLVKNRFEFVRLDNPRVVIIKDCYNANPGAFRQALDSFSKLPITEGKRIVVAGDMRELGAQSAAYHEELGRLIAASNVHTLMVLGEFSDVVAQAALSVRSQMVVIKAADNSQAAASLAGLLCDHDYILIKGSRALRLEEIVDRLCQEVTLPV